MTEDPECGARRLRSAADTTLRRTRRCAVRPAQRAPAVARFRAACAAGDPRSSLMRWRPRAWRRCSRSKSPVRGSSVRLHSDEAANPARRRAIISRFDFHASVQMHGSLAVLVIAKRLQRQRLQRGLFFGEHGGYLAFGGAMNARVGPTSLEAAQSYLDQWEERLTLS